MCFSKKQKKIFGRWLEGMGLGLMSGAMITFSIVGRQYWYWFIAGAVVTIIGELLNYSHEYR